MLFLIIFIVEKVIVVVIVGSMVLIVVILSDTFEKLVLTLAEIFFLLRIVTIIVFEVAFV